MKKGREGGRKRERNRWGIDFAPERTKRGSTHRGDRLPFRAAHPSQIRVSISDGYIDR